MRTRLSSRSNSWWKLHCRTHQAQNSAGKNKVSSMKGDGLSALTLQQGDNYSSILSHDMLMKLPMLRTITTIPQFLKVLSVHHHCKKRNKTARMYQWVTIWFLPESWVYITQEKNLIWLIVPHSMESSQYCIHYCLGHLVMAQMFTT